MINRLQLRGILKKVIRWIGYAALAFFFAMQLFVAMITPMPKALIHIGIVLAIGLWAINKFRNRENNAKLGN
jgi:uncharacterized membrane protein